MARNTSLPGAYPASLTASVIVVRASSTVSTGGANPPSSPMLMAPTPYLDLRMPFSDMYTSEDMRRQSEKDFAPAGMIMHSCILRFPPACFPPLMMLSIGTGSVAWSPPMCW